MVSADTPKETQNELRRLLLAEDAMLNVAEWRASTSPTGSCLSDAKLEPCPQPGWPRCSADPSRTTTSGSASIRTTGERLIADDPVQADMFDRILLRRDKVLAHVDTNAAVVNVANSYRMFQRPEANDPIVLRVYDVGADGGLLEPESLQLIAGLADRLALLMSHRMTNLGATRRPELMPPSEPSATQ